MLQLVFQHHSVSNFRNISQIREGSPAYLFNCHVEGNILIKNDSKFSHVFKILWTKYNNICLSECRRRKLWDIQALTHAKQIDLCHLASYIDKAGCHLHSYKNASKYFKLMLPKGSMYNENSIDPRIEPCGTP